MEPRIIKSDSAGNELGTGFAFRSWTYAMTGVALTSARQEEDVCLDTGCGVSLIDRDWRARQAPDTVVSKMTSPLKVRGVGSSKHETSEYITQDLYFPGTDAKGNEVLACIRRELHIVDELRAKMLIGNDIIGLEGIVIDVANKEAYIGSCKTKIKVTAHPRGEFVRRKIHVKSNTTVPPHSDVILPIKPIDLPANRDFLFAPTTQANIVLFSHLVDYTLSGVLARNETDSPIQVPRKLRLGNVLEMEYENCFQTSIEADFATVRPSSKSSDLKMPGKSLPPDSRSWNTGAQETRLPNGVMVYGDPQVTRALSDLVAEFPQVWEDTGFVNVPKDEWMKIPLKKDWQSRVNSRAKIYPLGIKDREVVDRVFDELHEQGRLEYTKNATPFSYPVFVVWKTLPNEKRKSRPVVDIRGLNDLILRDAYASPLQSEIVGMLAGCRYISVVDATSFFYQWRVHPDYRYMLTVVTHRGQETFNVPIMGCMNSIAYVQRQIDKILRRLRKAKAYIDDIVTGAATLPEHLQDLRSLFGLFVEYNITVSPNKAYLGYPDVNLLGRKVNSFGLISPEEKLKAISELRYSTTLGELEHYLGLTGYLRQYVHFYAQISKSLQELKTLLLKEAPVTGRQRKQYSSKKRLLEPTEEQMVSFQLLQDALSRPSILVHFSDDRILWIDLDASKEWGFGAVVFHVKDDKKVAEGKWPVRTDMEPILFISRLLTSAERNY